MSNFRSLLKQSAKLAAVGALIGGTPASLQAQQVDGLAYDDPTQIAQYQANGAAPQSSWVYQLFEEKNHDFGNVARGAQVKHRLKVVNPFEETVRLVSVGKTCGCTDAKAEFTELKTHETGYINIEMDTVKFLGEKKSNVLATFSFAGGSTATAQIPVRSFIRSDVVVQPGSADFGTVDLGAGSVKTLAVNYAGRSDWRIEDAQATSPFVDVSVEETSRTTGGVSYALKVALKPNAPVGTVRDRVILRTSDGETSTVPVLVEAKVEPDIVVSPAQVNLGKLQPGEQKTVNVVIRGKKPFRINEVICQESDCFQVRLEEQPKPVHIVPLTVKTPEEAGNLTERFEVMVEGRPEPIVFEAIGTVASK